MHIITIGIDLAKHVFQVHGVDENEKVAFNKPLRRTQLLPFLAKLSPCRIGMEACASAHYWAREIKKLGHDVRFDAGQGREGICQAEQERCCRCCGML